MLSKVLDQMNTVAIGGHIRPDGDCVGSCMGLYLYLKKCYPKLTVDVYLEDIPETFHFLAGTEDIRHTVKEGDRYDLFITLDCGDEDRLGFARELYENARHTFCIDHHISNRAFADENYIFPEASSTSELVYNLLEKEAVTKEIAEALYMGIVHDTGVFQYSCASPETFEAAAQLLRTGINGPELIEKTFYEKTYAQNQMLGRALLESVLFMDKKCIASAVTQKEMDFYKIQPKEMDGIVSQLRITQGVEVAIFMYEVEPNVFKVSLRSKDQVDVSKVAQYFGGGGHKKAAGFSMTGTIHDVINNLSKQIEDQFKQIDEGM